MATKAYKPVTAVRVFAWGDEVGAVVPDPARRAYAFQYTPKWIAKQIELAPLHMPLDREPYVFPLLPEPTYKGLPALLADSLPDDFGNALIDAYLAQKGVPKSSITALDRLAYLGERAMGALEFRPLRGPQRTKPTAIELHDLVIAARSVLQGKFDGDRETEAAIQNLLQVGTSAGGARAKAVIAWNSDTNQVMSGQASLEPGFDHWLLKLDGVARDPGLEPAQQLGTGQGYGRIEYAYYLMATAAGIEMSESRLLEENGRAHFMTKRFDREGAKKHHLQTLCAMDHLDYKAIGTHDYAQFFQVIQRLNLGTAATAQAFRRMAFNVMAANCDDHTKNISFILRRGEPWALAPGYDITHAHDPKNVWLSAHLMAVNGKFNGITSADLAVVGDRFSVPGIKSILQEVAETVANWQEFADQADIPHGVATAIQADHRLLI